MNYFLSKYFFWSRYYDRNSWHLDLKITFSLQYGKSLSIVCVCLCLVLKPSENLPKYNPGSGIGAWGNFWVDL